MKASEPAAVKRQDTSHLLRQFDIISESKLNQRITVIGAGAIGSFVVLSLVKMGFSNVIVYDFDEVSVENMNCQWYRFSDIGKKKVEALRDLIYDFTKETIEIAAEKYIAQPLEGIVISSVDSMSVRRNIWEQVAKNLGVSWFIDPRMASEYALNYVMNPHDSKDRITYEKTLYSDRDAISEPCTRKATMYTATMIAGHVAKAVKDVVMQQDYARVTQWDIEKNNQLTWAKQKIEA